MVFRARSVIVVSLVCLLPAAVVRAATLPAGFSEKLVASGLSTPTAMQFAPDGRLFVCEQGGRVRVIKDDVLLSTPFVTLKVDSSGERGLLGIAFDPAFASNGFVYVYYTTPTSQHNRVSRFTADGDVAMTGSEKPILDLDPLSGATNHNGGAMDFGSDGKLYVAVGENAYGPYSQTLDNRLGKMLRINSDGTIPTDNPFYNEATGANRAIWARGLRNPFTFAFNSARTQMFINDVGQGKWEEINEGRASANYGWPTTEGPTTNPAFDAPRYAYGHAGGSECAITGGAFYTPQASQFPAEYSGDYFFADFCGGWIRRFDPVAGGNPVSFASGIGEPVDLKVTDDGSLYYLARGSGAVYRISYGTPAPPSIARHPANLSVAIGAPATFNVTANGAPPLRYQWQRNGSDISGATGSIYTIGAVTVQDNGAKFRVRVTNAVSNALSNEATLTVTTTTNNPPTATIAQPTANVLYEGGSVINYAGTGTDPQDGILPASAFTWRIDFHHDTHAHPFLPSTTGARSGTVTIPTAGETSANVWYRIHLTVTDAGGLTHTVQRDISPRTVRLTLNTDPPGLQVRLDGQPMATPLSFDAVVGVVRNLSAQSPQTAGTATYAFVSWSDEGAEAHGVSTPAVNTTYTATYRAVAGGTGSPPAPTLSAYTNGLSLSLWWTPASGATSYRLEAGSAPNAADLLNSDVGRLTSLQSIVPPGTYFARIRSVGPGGVSAPSNEVSVTLVGSSPCATPPPAPSGYAAQTSDLSVRFAWNPSPSATSYVLEAGTSAGQANLVNVNVGNVHSISAIGPAGLYFTRLRAVNACGGSSPSTEVPVTLGCAGPPPPPVLTFTTTGGIVTLSWTASAGASIYRARVGTAPGLGNVFSGDLGSTNHVTVDARGITGNYFVRVFAANACGTSEASNEMAVTVP